MTSLIRSVCLTNHASLGKAEGLDPLAMLEEAGSGCSVPGAGQADFRDCNGACAE
jgi:hypothetical protein